MAWAKLDDRFHENPKVRRLWRTCPAALGLWSMALTYCAGNETDGEIDALWIEERCAFAGADDAPAALEAAGLLERIDDETWRIPSFLEFHPSRAQAEEKRATDAERKARGRRTQRDARQADRPADEPSARTPSEASDERPTGQDADSARTDEGVRAPSSGPDPTRPDPTVVSDDTTQRASGAAVVAAVPDGIDPGTWEGALEALAGGGFQPMGIEMAHGSIAHALRELRIPTDVDWWEVGRRILDGRRSGGLQREEPASALRWVANGAAGLPRRNAGGGRGRRSAPPKSAAPSSRFPVAAA